MQRELKGSLYYLQANLRYSFIIFWSIMIGTLALTILADLLIKSEEGIIAFNFSIPIYIFGAIFGFHIVKNVIPFLIKMGVTRKSLFISTGILLCGISLINSVIANTIHSSLERVYGDTMGGFISYSDGNITLTITHFADLFMDSTWISRVFIDMSLTFFFISLTLILGLIFYRYGLIGGFGTLGVVMLMFILAISRGWVTSFFVKLFENFHFTFFYQLFAVGIIIYLLSFILMRRITI
ncbi:hypothetical protein SPD48_11935 [Pseudogracilibacillus sp. SE30717A]|uniref:hypothetical protein n=1 Tax=Pseudogracilibacillus sp. SE30717A TaxID=3098293 RepID=UPI00300DE420